MRPRLTFCFVLVVVAACMPTFLSAQSITAQPMIHTVAGTGTAGYNGDNAGTASQLNYPFGVAVDPAGNLYIADQYNHRIRRVSRSGVMTTVAGTGTAGFSGDGSDATSAKLNNPYGVAVDSAGNVYIADTDNDRIRFVDAASGVISTVAGTGVSGFSGDGGAPTSAKLWHPTAVLVKGGNLYIADAYNNRVRLVAGGTITTLAGGGTGCAGQANADGDGCTPTEATLKNPYGIAVDANGNVFIVESDANRVRKISAATGLVSTAVGNAPYGFSGDGGPAVSAQLDDPRAVSVDSKGNLYVADAFNNRIRRVDATTGVITTVVGSGCSGCVGTFAGDDGPATNARLNYPTGLAVGGNGALYISDQYNHRIRKVQIHPDFGLISVGQSSTTRSLAFNFSSTTQVGSVAVLTQGATGKDFQAAGGTCVSGTYNAGDSCTVDVAFSPLVPGTRSGAVVLYDTATPPNALFTRYLSGVGTAPEIAFTPGIISTVPNAGTNNDGDPNALAFDGDGNLYIAETSSHIIRKLTPAGVATVVAGGGTGCAGQSDDHGDGCPATQAQLDSPAGVAVDGAGNIYIADSYYPSIRKVDARTGIISMVVGNGTSGSTGDGGPAVSARVYNPYVVIVDGAGNLYIPDIRRVRKVDAATGTIDTIAGTMTAGDSGDGGLATSANFNQPLGLALDTAGDLYIADYASHRVRKVNATTGIITTVAGTGSQGLTGDGGPATTARLAYPWGVAVDPAGNLYIADRNNHRVRKVDTGGVMTTIAGDRTGCAEQTTSYGDGCVATHAWLWDPIQLVLDAKGNLYVADFDGNMVRKLNVSDPSSLTFPSTNVGSVSAAHDVTIENLGNAELNLSQINVSANFDLQGVNTSCSTSGQLLAAGQRCVLGIEFAPQTGGAISGAAVLTDNALNISNTTQTIVLNGTGTGGSDATTQTSLISSPNPSTFGASVTFTATVSSASATPTGTVTFTDGATPLGSGTLDGSGHAVLSTSALTVGTHTITAAYTGATGFLASTSTGLTHTVTSGVASTAISVTSSGSPASYGGTVTFTATVTSASGIPTGSVTFMDGATTLGTANLNASGVATFSTQALGIGSHSISAAYGGATGYAASASAVLSQVINPAVLTVTADAKSMTYGGALPALTSSYSGYVGNDTAAVVTGAPACTTTATVSSSAGEYPITCTVGTLVASNYTFGFAPGTLTVNRAPLTVTAANQSRTFGAANPAFSVAFSGFVNADTASVVTGAAACTTTATSTSDAGTYPITCATGTLATTNYTFATFVPGTLTITAATSTTVLASSKPVVHLPAALTLTARVTSTGGTPTGAVTFFSGTTSLGSANLDNTGTATLTLTSPSGNGKLSLTAVYAGSTNIGGSTSGVLTQHVFPGAPDFKLAAGISQVTLRRGDQASVAITFTPLNGYDGTITFACPGLPLGVSCTFTPPQMVGNLESTPVTGTLLIRTTGPAQVSSDTRPVAGSRSRALLAYWSLGLGAFGVLLAGGHRRTRNLRSGLPWLIGSVFLLLLMLAGCGFHQASSATSNWTPTGTAMATVTATATATSTGTAPTNASQQLQIQITVTP